MTCPIQPQAETEGRGHSCVLVMVASVVSLTFEAIEPAMEPACMSLQLAEYLCSSVRNEVSRCGCCR